MASIIIETVSLADKAESMNEVKASTYVDCNTTKESTRIYNTISSMKLLAKNTDKSTAICSLSGIPVEVYLPSILSPLSSKLLSFSLPSASLHSLLDTPVQELYKASPAILAGLVLFSYSYHNLFISKNTNKGMDNALLQTTDVYTLVEAIKMINKIKANAFDFDILPKLDISYEVHSTRIKNFSSVISSYLASVEQVLIAEKHMQEELRLKKIELAMLEKEKREQIKTDKENNKIELARLKKERLEQIKASKENKKIELARLKKEKLEQIKAGKENKKRYADAIYNLEVLRKEATASLKTIAPYLMKAGKVKLLQAIRNTISSQRAIATASNEIKDKILTRLEELTVENSILDSYYFDDVDTIKKAIQESSGDRIVKAATSNLERVSDISKAREATASATKLSLKEKIALKLQQAQYNKEVK